MFETFEVLITDEVGRIDKVLQDHLKMTRSTIQSLLKQELVHVNDKIVKANYKVKNGDGVVINVPIDKPIEIIPEKMDLLIVYEDSDVAIINKPSGLVVHPSKGHSQHTLVNGLMYHLNTLSTGSDEVRPGIVHRIDKDTSGLLVVAKTNEAHLQLSEQLQDHSMERTYVALVHGVIQNETGTIDAPLSRDKSNRLKWQVDINGKRSVTHFKVLKRFQNYTLVSLQLETGRTHQIRVHMAYINHPLVGDPVYSNKQDDKTYGQLLHAKTLGFVHPTTKKKMTFDSQLPDFFVDILKTLT